MSRTKCYDKDGNEIDMEDYLRDAPTYAQEQLAEIKRREAVDHPDYYKRGGVEAIDAIEAWGLGFCLGNVVKYIARAGRKTKDGLRDLKKAEWYLSREIKNMEHKSEEVI